MAQPGVEAGPVDPELIADRPPTDRIDLGWMDPGVKLPPVDGGARRSTRGRPRVDPNRALVDRTDPESILGCLCAPSGLGGCSPAPPLVSVAWTGGAGRRSARMHCGCVGDDPGSTRSTGGQPVGSTGDPASTPSRLGRPAVDPRSTRSRRRSRIDPVDRRSIPGRPRIDLADQRSTRDRPRSTGGRGRSQIDRRSARPKQVRSGIQTRSIPGRQAYGSAWASLHHCLLQLGVFCLRGVTFELGGCEPRILFGIGCVDGVGGRSGSSLVRPVDRRSTPGAARLNKGRPRVDPCLPAVDWRSTRSLPGFDPVDQRSARDRARNDPRVDPTPTRVDRRSTRVDH